MGLRTLAASAAAFFLLGLLAWWLLGRERAPVPTTFFALKQRIPDTLTVTSAADTTAIVPGSDNVWEVVRPVRYPADGVLVNAMVKQLSDLQVERRFPLTPQKMDTYGMRFPQAVLRAAYADGRTADTLTIGGFTFDDAYTYVRNGSRSEVGLIPARTARGTFIKRTDELRDTQLLPFLENRVVRFATLGEGRDTVMTLERREDRTWRISRPYPGPADGRKVGEYLESVSHMHVDAFVREGDGPLEPYGLARPRAGARVELEDGRWLGLDLGNPIPGTDLLYARTLTRPHVLGVSTKYLPVLQWNPDRLRRAAVLDFGMKDATRVVIEDSGRSHSLALVDSLPRDVTDVLGNWLLLAARRFEPATRVRLHEAGFDRSGRRLVWMQGDSTLARIELGFPSGEDTPLHVAEGARSRPDEILYAPRDTVEPLFQALVRNPGIP